MHESPIAREFLDAVLKKASAQGRGKIKKIYFAIGEASGVNPESIQHYFDEFASGTIAEGAELEFTKTSVQIYCWMCKKSSEVSEIPVDCPFCGMEDFKIEPARTIRIEEIEVE